MVEAQTGTPFEAAARVTSKSDTSSRDGTVSLWRIGLLLPGESRPWDWTAFEDTRGVADLVKNELYRFELVRKTNPNGQYPYRNLVAVLGPADEGDMAQGTPSTVRTTAQPPPTPRQADGAEVTAWADHPSKRRSIERQQALGFAIQWLPEPETGDIRDDQLNQLLSVAETFYAWVSASKPPQAQQAARTATDGALPTPESAPAPEEPLFGPDLNLTHYFTEHGELTKDGLKGFLTEQFGDSGDVADGKVARALQWVVKNNKTLRQAAELMLETRTGNTNDF